MNDKIAAWEGARKFAAQFQGMLKGMEQLGQIGSIEQAGNEAATRLQALQEQHDALLNQIEDDKKAAANHLNKKRAEAEAIIDAAKKEADRIKSDAAAEATDWRAKTADEVKETRKSAQMHSEQAQLNAARLMKETDESLAEKRQTIIAHQQRIAELEPEIRSKQARLNEINQHLDQLRAKL